MWSANYAQRAAFIARKCRKIEGAVELVALYANKRQKCRRMPVSQQIEVSKIRFEMLVEGDGLDLTAVDLCGRQAADIGPGCIGNGGPPVALDKSIGQIFARFDDDDAQAAGLIHDAVPLVGDGVTAQEGQQKQFGGPAVIVMFSFGRNGAL